MLAGSSAIAAPILLHALLPLTSGEEPLRVDASRMVGTLFLTQLIPLGIGLVVRQYRPDLADKLRKPANRLSAALNVAVFSLIVVVDFHLLASIRVLGFEGILLLVIAALAAGWLLGGPDGDRRTAMTFSTGARNVSVGLVIATSSFPRTPAVTAVVAYALFQTIVLSLLAMGWGRCTVPTRRTAGGRRTTTPSELPPTRR
jgi:BASS family bile acid:Na+ symporter